MSQPTAPEPRPEVPLDPPGEPPHTVWDDEDEAREDFVEPDDGDSP